MVALASIESVMPLLLPGVTKGKVVEGVERVWVRPPWAGRKSWESKLGEGLFLVRVRLDWHVVPLPRAGFTLFCWADQNGLLHGEGALGMGTATAGWDAATPSSGALAGATVLAAGCVAGPRWGRSSEPWGESWGESWEESWGGSRGGGRRGRGRQRAWWRRWNLEAPNVRIAGGCGLRVTASSVGSVRERGPAWLGCADIVVRLEAQSQIERSR